MSPAGRVTDPRGGNRYVHSETFTPRTQNREGRTRGWRLLFAFLVGPLGVVGGSLLAFDRGLSFYPVWYIGIGTVLLAFGIVDLLRWIELPRRTLDEAMRTMGRAYTLGFMLLLFLVFAAIGTILLARSWLSSVVGLALAAASILFWFLLSLRWTRARKDS